MRFVNHISPHRYSAGSQGRRVAGSLVLPQVTKALNILILVVISYNLKHTGKKRFKMTQKNKESLVEAASQSETKKNENITKTCFVIMPIADMEDYEPGHFLRVYEHLVKPACHSAGFEASRADFVAASNYIIIDILKKILDSDMVICDLSGRNPNVLYELGVRQAFNLPTVLIKDVKTPKIFDIQGLRYTEYNHALRIDEVEKERERIKQSLIETAENPHDINSMIQLLGVQPAPLPNKLEISNETSVILESLKDISLRLSNIESPKNITTLPKPPVKNLFPAVIRTADGKYKFNKEIFTSGQSLFIGDNHIGDLIGATSNDIKLQTKDNQILTISSTSSEFKQISGLPF